MGENSDLNPFLRLQMEIKDYLKKKLKFLEKKKQFMTHTPLNAEL